MNTITTKRLLCFIAIGYALASVAKGNTWKLEDKDIDLKLSRDDHGLLDTGLAVQWDLLLRGDTKWVKLGLFTEGTVQTDEDANGDPLKAGVDAKFAHIVLPLACGDSEETLHDASLDLSVQAGGESNQRFTEAQTLAGLKLEFRNHNPEHWIGIIPSVAASLDRIRSFESDARKELELDEQEQYTRWSLDASWRFNLSTFLFWEGFDRFYLQAAVTHTEEVSPDSSWEATGRDTSDKWRVELESKLGDVIGDRRSGVVTDASIFIGFESGEQAPALEGADTIYLKLRWDAEDIFKK